MAAATSITESEARIYAHAELGNFAPMLGWTVGAGSYNEIVNDATAEYGVELVSSVSGVKRTQLMKACIRYILWRSVTNVSNVMFTLAEAGTSLSLSHLNEHARKSMESALSEIQRLRRDVASDDAGLDPGGVAATVTSVIRPDSEYPKLGEEALSEYAR